MIKFNNFAYMSAIALIGAVGFTACSSDDDLSNPNPTFDGETVKTQFAINIPYANGGTRMSEDIVQEGNKKFRGMQDIYLIPTTGSAVTTFSDVIGLGNITVFDNQSSNPGNYKIYNDVNIPIGTKFFHFYGQALKSDDVSDMVNGVLETTLPSVSSTDGIIFNLKPVNENNGGIGRFTTGQDKMVAVLNSVASAFGTPTDPSKMKDLYDAFITMRAGSANSIKIALENLYNALPTTDGDAVKAAIAGDGKPFTYVDETKTLKWQSGYDANFPTSIGLPEGAAQVEWNATESKFEANVPGGNSYTVNAANICYPAALYYYIGTDAKTKDESVSTWPSSASEWEDYDWVTNNWGSEVKNTTRTVALDNNVQYSVGNLKATFRCSSATLPDNGETLGHQTNYVAVPSDGFPVTAILVGGQPENVGYDFTGPTDANKYVYTIYDSIPVNKCSAKNGSASSPNYTLVLDNSKNTNANKLVYVALELTNNSGTDFYGHDGLIPNGGKFYLIGELDPAKGTYTGDTKPGNVFTKDYITTANFSISTLKDAYVAIPDLRASGLELGLSVDLEWQTGLSFDVEIK